MKSTSAVVFALGVAVAACGKKSDSGAAVQDSASGRDLSLAPVDTTAVLNDRPKLAESTAVVPPPAPEPAPPPAPEPTRPPVKKPARPAPAPAPTPAPSPPPAAAPAPAPAPAPSPPPPPARKVRSLEAGQTVALASTQEFGTKTHKIGQTITATVASDLQDASGTTVIPAGSVVTLSIVDLKVSDNKSDSGKVVLRATQVSINGETHDIAGVSGSVEHTLKGRGVKAGDAAKVGAGAAAGAIVGSILGKGKGAVVGGVVGAAAGTAIAINSADRDVVVPVGARIILKLTDAFKIS